MNTMQLEKGAGSGKIIKAGNVAVLDPHAAKPAPAHAVETKKESRVRLIKEGDVVKSIEVRCSCGEVIRLDCEY